MRTRVALLLLILVLPLAWSQCEEEEPDVERRRKDRRPWFCHGRDCPSFKTVGAEARGGAAGGCNAN